MATFDASVRPAVAAEQQDLIEHPEHCSADAEALAGIGRGLGHQVRVRLVTDPGVFALYTVSQVRDETSVSTVRMGRDGRERLGVTEPFSAVVDSVVPRRRLSDADAARLGEFVERLTDDGTHRGLIVIAPHGGDIEAHTDSQAERVAARLSAHGVSAWRCMGFGGAGGGAWRRLHITSTDLHEASFPALASIIDRGFAFAVAFHGFTGEEILVGGGASFRLKAEIAAAIETALGGTGIPVRIAGPDDVLGGSSPRNVVNRLTASGRGGVHIEQSLPARAGHALAIADAVAGVFASRLASPGHPGPRWWQALRQRWDDVRRHLDRWVRRSNRSGG